MNTPNTPPPPKPEILSDLKALATYQRLVREKLMPVFHDAVTWAIHETGTHYSEDDRRIATSGILAALTTIVMYEAGAGRPKRADWLRLVETLAETTASAPDDSPITDDLAPAAVLQRIERQLEAVWERIDRSIDVLSPSTDDGEREVVAQRVMAAMLDRLDDRFDVASDPHKVQVWMGQLLGGLGLMVDDVSVEVADDG